MLSKIAGFFFIRDTIDYVVYGKRTIIKQGKRNGFSLHVRAEIPGLTVFIASVLLPEPAKSHESSVIAHSC